MRRDAEVRSVPENFGIAEKAVLVRLDRVRFQFDDGLASQRADPLNPRPGFERLQREEQIGLPVPAR